MYIYYRDSKIYIISDTPLVVPEYKHIFSPGLKIKPNDLLMNYKVFENKLVSADHKLNPLTAKIAFISVWGITCGISTYSQYLVNEMAKINPNIKIFSEDGDGQTYNFPNLVRCWKRGESLERLIKEIHAYSPDVIYIQHEYGIFPDARKWSRLISALHKYKTFVTLHSVYKHKDKAVCEAICKNLIVHTHLAKQVLEEKGITSEINVIPHGCSLFEETSRLWNIYKTPHTLVQFGFGFEYKGWDVALKAISILKEKYPDIFYQILFSESGFSKGYHDVQYSKLTKLIEELGVEENVSIIRGFQSDASLCNFLRTARVAIFPYTANPEHIVYGSSGAARIAMANGTPTIVSNVPLFYDLKETLPHVENAEELAKEIDKLFSEPAYYKDIAKKESEFVQEHGWGITAKRYLALIDRSYDDRTFNVSTNKAPHC